MRPDERDLAYLWDMLEAARGAQRLIAGLDFAAFVDDERTSLAIERLLENVGEAARHVSSVLQDRHPKVPWQGIIGLRNVLAHQYGVVDQRKVWEAAKEGVSALIPLLEAVLSAESQPTWSVPPALCDFTSEMHYEGRLAPAAERSEVVANCDHPIRDSEAAASCPTRSPHTALMAASVGT